MTALQADGANWKLGLFRPLTHENGCEGLAEIRFRYPGRREKRESDEQIQVVRALGTFADESQNTFVILDIDEKPITSHNDEFYLCHCEKAQGRKRSSIDKEDMSHVRSFDIKTFLP